MTATPPADEVLSTLRAFQRRTARYAFSRLFHPDAPSVRFLVADEVGLGKTLVARGVIAQVVDHLSGLGDKRVDIVYICSNAAIARQNLRKLNIAGDDAVVEADRFTMLTNEVHRLEKRSLNLVAVTPGTSLEFGSSAGKFPERALLYAVLRRVWGEDAMRGSGAERVFYLGISDDKAARRRLRDKAARMRPSSSVIAAFRQQIRRLNEQRRLDDRPTLRVEFNRLARTFHYKDGYTQKDREQRNRFIVELRQALATVGIEALQPDLVILDEFQRFRSLLDRTNQSWATRLAHELFDYREPATGRPTRTLLLSATPYRPYTTANDAEGDNHFEDFLATARFLLDDDLAAEALGDDLRDLRRSLLVLDRDGGATAALACQRVGDRLRPVMARTERLASTPDRNGMLADATTQVSLERTDIDGYLTAAHAADLLGQRDVVEYWKSGPYLLNFMEGYALKHAFDDLADGGPAPTGLRDLIEQGRGLLDWGEVAEYGKVDRANARLRALSADTIGRGMWQLLWLPPALPYYDADGVFDVHEARTFTKRLVFSSWHLVPKVISALLSFEAERAMFNAAGELDARPYDEFSQRPDRRLDFRVNAETGRLEGMPVLLLVVPFVELARLADPLALASGLGGKGRPRRTEVEAAARDAITAALGPLVAGRPATGQVDQRWYWAAPLLLDHRANPERTTDWWSREAWPSLWSADSSDDATGGAFYRHLEAAQDLLEGDDEPLGRVPDDLVDVLVAAALAGPAICALRSLWRITESSDDRDPMILAAAARTAWGFRSLLNGPDATAVVRAATGIDVHWRAVLEYGIVGHLQAVLDEYLHVLKDWRGFLSDAGPSIVSDLAETAVSALSLRTVNYVTDIPRIDNGGVAVDRHTMRGRFAIRFGDQAIEGEQRQQRAQQASHAFNSPFWPFVLTTTSIGQEGLDFHLYSHAVVHWNIPNNPVDFEQREGRVHRYKGHAIRKNVAHACWGAAFIDPAADPWAAMFEAAADRADTDGELQPYWVFHPDGAPARIERHVPVLPLSRDASKLDRLLKAVATYRLSFGQPRQEELISYLAGRVPDDELATIIDRLKVDLTPAEIS
ncbi:MAG: helicase-related protein [Baekduia sp.]